MTKKDLINQNQVVHAMMCAAAENNRGPVFYEEMLKVAKRLHRIETTLRRLAIMQCSDRRFGQAEKARFQRLEALALRIFHEATGCDCHCQNDPRGAIIRMHLPKFYNSWDGETTILNW